MTKHQNYRRNMGLKGGQNGPEMAHWPISCTCLLERKNLGTYTRRKLAKRLFSFLGSFIRGPAPVLYSSQERLRNTENSLVPGSLFGQPHPLLGQTGCSYLSRRPERVRLTLILSLGSSHGAEYSDSGAHPGCSPGFTPPPLHALQAAS